MWRLPLSLVLWLSCANFALAEENGPTLLSLFQKTCARQPATGEALDALATENGYASQFGKGASPEKDSDRIDLLYFWKLPQGGSKFALSAYMTGSRNLYRIDCSIGADHVAIDELVAALRKSANLPEARAEVKPDTDVTTLTWNLSTNSLQVTYGAKNSRRWASITFDYEVKKQ